MSSQVNKPVHYQTDSGMEAIDVIEAFNLGFNLGNAAKYLLRAGKKDSRTIDLEKALWYIQRELGTEAKPEATEDALPYYREGRRFRITKTVNGPEGDVIGDRYIFADGCLVNEYEQAWSFDPDDYKSEGRYVCGNTIIEFVPEDALPYFREGRRFVITKSDSMLKGWLAGDVVTYREGGLVDESGYQIPAEEFREGAVFTDVCRSEILFEFEPEDA